MAAQKRRINELTAGEIDPVVQSLIPFVAALDREDEKTAAVVEAIESLFFKLKQSSVRRSSSSCACIHIQHFNSPSLWPHSHYGPFTSACTNISGLHRSPPCSICKSSEFSPTDWSSKMMQRVLSCAREAEKKWGATSSLW